jgi:zinc transport system permease protein
MFAACPAPPLAALHWLDAVLDACTRHAPEGTFFSYGFNVRALLALICVAFCCGSVGALVVGGRMAFFSDALAHCAFAGVSIGFLIFDLLLSRPRSPDLDRWILSVLIGLGVLCGAGLGWMYRTGRRRDQAGGLVLLALAGALAGGVVSWLVLDVALARPRSAAEFWHWVTPLMAGFGILIGAGIAYVRGRTGLSSDTVIGVFFAASIGLAAAIRKLIRNRNLFNLEDFLFGDPLLVSADDLVVLGLLALFTAVLLAWIFNPLLLASFNNSLALSRRVPVRLVNYLLVVLLALIVNLCLRAVGVLLINALLIVPAAAAVNLAANLRQAFWLSVGLCLSVAVAGQLLSWEVGVRTGVEIGTPGTVVLLSVAVFAVSMLIGPAARVWLGRRRPARGQA